MSRTPIPDHLIHRPDEVKRDAERFDHLCRLAEEVALPVARKALARETAAAGAEILADEAKRALEALAEEGSISESLDEHLLLEALQKGLGEEVPIPDDEECRQHARDWSQVLMSVWLESLREGLSKMPMVRLSEDLLPEISTKRGAWLTEMFARRESQLSPDLTIALGSFALNDEDIRMVLARLRAELFPETQVVDLPFDLVMMGTPTASNLTLVMERSLYDRAIDVVQQHLESNERAVVEQNTREFLREAESRYFATAASKSKGEMLDIEAQLERIVSAAKM